MKNCMMCWKKANGFSGAFEKLGLAEESLFDALDDVTVQEAEASFLGGNRLLRLDIVLEDLAISP